MEDKDLYGEVFGIDIFSQVATNRTTEQHQRNLPVSPYHQNLTSCGKPRESIPFHSQELDL